MLTSAFRALFCHITITSLVTHLSAGDYLNDCGSNIGHRIDDV